MKILLFLILVLLIITYNGFSIRSLSCEYDKDTIIRGRDFLKTKKVAFCGLVRDGEERLSHIIPQVEEMGGYFKEWIALIVENDSKDRTRGKLLDWSNRNNKVFVLGCEGINLPECKLNMKATADHSTSDYRIKKMAYLRNIYLDELRKQKYSDIDYVIVWDFDLIGVIDIKGLFNTGYRLSTNTDIKAICANGIMKIDLIKYFTNIDSTIDIPAYYYYDTYAYRGLSSSKYNLSKGIYDRMYSVPESSNQIKKVKSCFGGFTIYKKDAISSLNYGTYLDKNGTTICEHQYLNEKIDGVYHDNGLLYIISEN